MDRSGDELDRSGGLGELPYGSSQDTLGRDIAALRHEVSFAVYAGTNVATTEQQAQKIADVATSAAVVMNHFF